MGIRWGVAIEDLKGLDLAKIFSQTLFYHKIGWLRVFRRFSLVGWGGGGVLKKLYFWSLNMILRKSFWKTPPVFCHFLIFWCKLARCFQKRLIFGPPVSLQRKSSKNSPPFSSHFLKEIQVPEIIARWCCLSKLHFNISLKRGPKGKKVKGLDLIDTYQTYWLN